MAERELNNRTRIKVKRKRQNGKGVFIILIIVAAVLMARGMWLKSQYRDYDEIYDYVNNNSPALVVEGKAVDSLETITYLEGEVYIPVDAVKEYIDEHIYWDGVEDKLIITTANNVIRMESDELNYYINNEEMELNLPIYTIEEQAYLPRAILEELYDVNIKYNNENDIVTIDYTDKEMKTATAKYKTKLYYDTEKDSYIVTNVKKGEQLHIFETEGDYTLARTEDGMAGYIPTKALDSYSSAMPITKESEQEELWQVSEGRINMYFEQVFNVNANYDESRKVSIDGVDVISPTWFSFENANGDIKNIADKGYVDWAHSNGYQVWGLITDNFDATISHGVLSSSETREHVIKQILAYISLYNLDGINIDFENVPKSDGEYFVQFLRELTPMAHQQGAVVSVDTFVPKPWTKHYNRNAVGEIVDYVIVMGYDEHYSGSSESGSVASIGWSEEAITETLAEGVDKSKLILGVPFYTRVWTETQTESGIELGCKSYSMEGAYNVI